MDVQTQNYLRYYTTQAGGRLDTFQGARRGQYGSGLGDILSGIFRTIFPIVAHGASTFLGELGKNKEEGNSWKDSAKNALAPAAHQMIGRVSRKLRKRQSGGGRRRKRRRTQKKFHISNLPQSGGKFKRHSIRKRKSYNKKDFGRKRRPIKNNRIKFLNF